MRNDYTFSTLQECTLLEGTLQEGTLLGVDCTLLENTLLEGTLLGVDMFVVGPRASIALAGTPQATVFTVVTQ